MSQIEKILQEALALPPGELRRLIEMLSRAEATRPAMTEEEFQEYLAKEGIISAVPEALTSRVEQSDFIPINVQGAPLSETIIEERR